MKKINPTVIGQIFLLTLIIVSGGLIVLKMIPYISGVLGGITFYIIFRKWMVKLLEKGWKRTWAALLILVVSFIGIFLPVAGVIFMLSSEIGNLVDKSESVVKAVQEQVFVLEKAIDYDVASKMDPSGTSTWITDNLSSLAGGTFNMFISVAIMYFLLYYMLTTPKEKAESFLTYIPISKRNLAVIGRETRAMVRSNAIGIPLVGLAQGIIALIGFFIFGVENPLFWFVIVAIGSMVPFIGTMLGFVPVFILSLASGNDFQAWGVFIYGLVVVGSADNIIRLFLLKKLDNVHPLITVIGVIVGIPLFGFIGLIFGPLLISLFFIIIRIYKMQYGILGEKGST